MSKFVDVTFKTTRKLFAGKYQYKLTIETTHTIRDQFALYKYNKLNKNNTYDMVLNVIEVLDTISEYYIKVNAPYVNICCNDYNGILRIVYTLKPEYKVYSVSISKPPENIELTPGTIYCTLPFDYKVHIKPGIKNQEFVNWANDNKNVRLTYGCRQSLSESFFGWHTSSPYFYIKGEKNLLLSQLYLGHIFKKHEIIIPPLESTMDKIE